MELFEEINIYIQIALISACLGAYVFWIYKQSQAENKNYKFISSNKFLFHFYNFLILILCLLEAILHQCLKGLLGKRFRLIVSGRGKALLIFCISMFFIANNEIHFLIMGIVYIVSAVGLFLFDQLFNCNTDYLESARLPLKAAQAKIEIITPEMKLDSNKEDEKEEEKKETVNTNPYDIPDDF